MTQILKSWIAPPISLLILFIAASAYAQNPTGRPDDPSKLKKPPAKAKPKPAPEPPSVTLTVMTEPEGCEVLINGEQRGATGRDGKVQFTKLALGHYSIEVRKTGYAPSLRGFNAGTDSPTLVFKLIARLDDVLAEFNSLVNAEKLAPPQDPNALDLVRKLSARYPDRPEAAQMRAQLADRLVNNAGILINRSITEWRSIKRDDIVAARDIAANAVELNAKDNHIQSRVAYLGAILAFRDWLTNRPDGEQPQSGESKSEEGQGLDQARAGLAKAAELDESWAAALLLTGRQLIPAMAMLLALIIGATVLWNSRSQNANELAFRPSEVIVLSDMYEYRPTADDVLETLVGVEDRENGR